MIYPTRKFIAVILAIWLPLFSGNALAASVAMWTMNGGCASMAMHPAVNELQVIIGHDQQLPASEDQSANNKITSQHHPQNSICHDNNVCHFACAGFLATVTVKLAGALLLAQTYVVPSSQFQSFTSAPLDPPPLTRV